METLSTGFQQLFQIKENMHRKRLLIDIRNSGELHQAHLHLGREAAKALKAQNIPAQGKPR
ncbi:MAG: hypothetical protein GX945_03060 [Lentisphaerae bacterium]|nr:hypothetical protein [Lentisphaerota bacterium]